MPVSVQVEGLALLSLHHTHETDFQQNQTVALHFQLLVINLTTFLFHSSDGTYNSELRNAPTVLGGTIGIMSVTTNMLL